MKWRRPRAGSRQIARRLIWGKRKKMQDGEGFNPLARQRDVEGLGGRKVIGVCFVGMLEYRARNFSMSLVLK